LLADPHSIERDGPRRQETAFRVQAQDAMPETHDHAALAIERRQPVIAQMLFAHDLRGLLIERLVRLAVRTQTDQFTLHREPSRQAFREEAAPGPNCSLPSWPATRTATFVEPSFFHRCFYVLQIARNSWGRSE
jgi:hypothetical protein